MNKTTISIDLELYKYIQANLQSFDETSNQVLKRLLNLTDKSKKSNSLKLSDTSGFKYKGVYFENGFKMRKIKKGEIHILIAQDGYFLLNDEKFKSPSSAGMSISKGAVNGWIYWEYQDKESGLFRPIDYLRKK